MATRVLPLKRDIHRVVNQIRQMALTIRSEVAEGEYDDAGLTTYTMGRAVSELAEMLATRADNEAAVIKQAAEQRVARMRELEAELKAIRNELQADVQQPKRGVNSRELLDLPDLASAEQAG